VAKRERARAARAMATAMRAAGNKESEGGKVMAIATRMADKWTATVTKRATAMATRVAGEGQQQRQRGQLQWQG
jgi:hypothetical protein